MPAKFGRRADGDPTSSDAGTGSALPVGEAATQKRPADKVMQAGKLRTLDDGVDEEVRQQSVQKLMEEKERLVKRVAEAPVGYAAAMPKLSDLNVSNLWGEFLQTVHQDYDISALTACLSQQLDDEDVPWNPEMLLVQLMSDMLDAADSNDNEAASGLSPDAAAAAGAARRRRKVLLEEVGEPTKAAKGRRHKNGSTASAPADSDNSGISGGGSDGAGSSRSRKTPKTTSSGEKDDKSSSRRESRSRGSDAKSHRSSHSGGGATPSNASEKNSRPSKQVESKEHSKQPPSTTRQSSGDNKHRTSSSRKSLSPKSEKSGK